MKLRVQNGILGVAIATLGLTFGCGDDSTEGGGDAGLEAGAASSTSGDTTSDVDDSETEGDTTLPPAMTTGSPTAMPTMSADPECDEEPLITCDGNDRIRIDGCQDSPSAEVIETCEGACENGRCVDCATTAGVICDDGDVHRQDSCGNVGPVAEACVNGCSRGMCIPVDCTPDADTECAGNLVFSVDSCGNQTNVEDVCEAGCEGGACIGCTDEGETLCYVGDVYPVDSCGRTGAALEECTGSCAVSVVDGVSTATCTDAVCEPTEDTECFKGDLYAVDSCGGILDDVVTDCPSGCDETGCLECVPFPVGVTCYDGDVYDTIGGCDEPSVRSETVKEVCNFGCFNGECAEEGECAQNGTVCADGDVHSIDTCLQVGPVVEECANGCLEGACIVEGPIDGGTGDVPDASLDSGTGTDPLPTDASTEPTSNTEPTEDSGTGVVDSGADAGSDSSTPMAP